MCLQSRAWITQEVPRVSNYTRFLPWSLFLCAYLMFFLGGGGGGMVATTVAVPNLGPVHSHFCHGATGAPVLCTTYVDAVFMYHRLQQPCSGKMSVSYNSQTSKNSWKKSLKTGCTRIRPCTIRARFTVKENDNNGSWRFVLYNCRCIWETNHFTFVPWYSGFQSK